MKKSGVLILSVIFSFTLLSVVSFPNNINAGALNGESEILEVFDLWGTYVEASGTVVFFGSNRAEGAFSLTAVVDRNEATFVGMFISNEIAYNLVLIQTYNVKLDYSGYKLYIYGKWMIMGSTYPPYIRTGNGELKIYAHNTVLITITGVPTILGIATYYRVIRYPFAIPLLGQPDIWVPQNYTTIQDAINAANAGDSIFVSAGTYYEHVVVDKPVTLVGEDRDHTIIDGEGWGIVVTVAADNVTINNFTIRNSGKLGRGIIWTEKATVNVNITGNTLSDHGIGVAGSANISNENFYIVGNNISDNLIAVYLTGNNSPLKILGNVITRNSLGIQLENANNTRIVDNIISNNTQYGVRANNTCGSVLFVNNVTANEVSLSLSNSVHSIVGYNLFCKGNDVNVEEMKSFWFIGNTVTNNTNNGLTVINATNTVIAGNQILSNGKNGLLLTMKKEMEERLLGVAMVDNVISGNGKHGLLANFGFKVEIEGVIIQANTVTNNNDFGLYLQNSTNAQFENNTISGNGFGGVFLGNSTNNTFVNNTITSNGYSLDATSYPYRSGVYINMSDNNTFANNNIGYNRDHGVAIENSYGLNVSYNLINQNELCGLKRYMDYPLEIALHSPSYYIGNVINNNTNGIEFENVTSATIARNTIQNNNVGIRLTNSNNNTIIHNNFINNKQQAEVTSLMGNMWDNGAEGNYWSDYTGVDMKSGYNQDQPGSDGIGDTEYVIDANNMDRYPLIYPYGTQTYKLTIATTSGGTTTPSPGTYTYADGAIVKVTAIPSIGFYFAYWLLDGVDRAKNPITIIMDANHILEAYFVDDIPPEISDPIQDPSPGNVEPNQDVTIWVNVTDLGTGICNVTLWYRINNETSWTVVNMAALPIPSDMTVTYEATLPGYENCTWITYKIVAYDNAGNDATKDKNGYGYKYHVIPEFSSAKILTLFLSVTLTATIISKKKKKPKPT